MATSRIYLDLPLPFDITKRILKQKDDLELKDWLIERTDYGYVPRFDSKGIPMGLLSQEEQEQWHHDYDMYLNEVKEYWGVLWDFDVSPYRHKSPIMHTLYQMSLTDPYDDHSKFRHQCELMGLNHMMVYELMWHWANS